MHLQNKPIVIDLFSGAGGTVLGLRKAGFDVRVAVDIDPHKAYTLSINHPKTYVLGSSSSGDIRQIKGKDLLRVGKIRKGKLSLLVGCPPCQGFSIQGNRDPNDVRNSLYLEFLRLVKELNPKTIAFENVPGILSIQSGEVIDNLLSTLDSFGYEVELLTANAKDFGIPQSRKRIFVVGTKEGNLPSFPRKNRKITGVWEAIADLPVYTSKVPSRNLVAKRYKHEPRSSYASRLRGSRKFVTNCQSTMHSPELLERIRLLKWEQRDGNTWHVRLHPRKPAPTLTAGTRTRTACRPIHPYANRVLTVREAARLTSFPDWYVLPNHKAEAWSQIGNSVPPIMAEVLFKQFNML